MRWTTTSGGGSAEAEPTTTIAEPAVERTTSDSSITI
jgi:hypothetical protein